MFSDLKRYPEYGELYSSRLVTLPARWSLRRIKSLVREVDRRSQTGEERLLSLRANAGLVDHHALGGKLIPAGSLVGYKLVEPGELVMNRMRAASGVFGIAQFAGLVSPDYAVFKILHASVPSYLLSLLKSPMMGATFRSESKGLGTGESGFLRLYSDRFGAIGVPSPPIVEQAAIVKFLGHANARIDRAITAKRKMIALLEEQKQAITMHAVTRGLDPTCTLKDSGVQCLHQIPSHWHVAPVGSGASLIQTGPFGGQLHAEEYVAGGTPVINPSHIVRETISADMATSVSREKAHELRRHALETGDVIAARRGELGRCAVISAKEAGWLCGTGSLLIRLKPTVFDAAYFQLAFSSRQSREQLSAGSIGATMANLNSQMVARLRLPRPPLAEQTDIVQAVRAVSLDSTRRISIVQREITVLGEFRTRLTADVVTGQLDVREAAANLPDLDPAELVPTEVDDSDDLDAVVELLDEVPA